MLFGCVINLLDLIINLPFGVKVCALPLLAAAIVLYTAAFFKMKKR